MTIREIQSHLQIFLCSLNSFSNTAYKKMQLSDRNLRYLEFYFNNTPFSHDNFKRDIRSVNVPINHSVRNYFQ